MSDAKHTPGEWGIDPFVAQVNEIETGQPICKMLWPTDVRCEDETKANARLIAAAPMLLDALDTLTAVVGLTPVKGNLEALQTAFDQACVAIAATTGEEA